MHWYQTLGEIVWNCAQLTMSFNHKGDKVTLVGEKQQNDNFQIFSKVKPAEGQPILLAIQGASTFQSNYFSNCITFSVSLFECTTTTTR